MDERDGRDMIDEYKRTVEEMQQEREIKERLRHFTIEIAKVKKLNSLSSRALSMIDNAFSLSALNQRYMPPKSGLSVYSPEYDLFKIGQLEDVESFIARAHERRASLITKQGWNFSGKKLNAVLYIKKRIRQIEDNSQIPFRVLLTGASKDITSKSNAFIWKKRGIEKNPLVTSFMFKGKVKNPIVDLEVLPPELMKYEYDDSSRKITNWIFNGRIIIPPEDICHIAINKRTGFVFGTPRLIPAENDVESLRKIEQNIETLIYLFVFPLLWYSLGENQSNIFDKDGTSPSSIAVAKLEEMINNGGVVTPPGDKVDLLNVNGTIDYEPFLKYMKNRVYTGLGVSSVDMGEAETSNRATADNLSRSLIDSIKADQKIISAVLEFSLIRDLLRESRNFSSSNENNDVFLSFNEIDINALVKWENHNANLFNNNVITHPETRIRIGEDVLGEKEMLGLQINLFGQGPKASSAIASTSNPQNQHNSSANLKNACLLSFVKGIKDAGAKILPEDVRTFKKLYDHVYKEHFGGACLSHIDRAKIIIAEQHFYSFAKKMKDGYGKRQN